MVDMLNRDNCHGGHGGCGGNDSILLIFLILILCGGFGNNCGCR